MDSRTITLIASIAVIGIVAVGAGYAYTALSINSDNNASSQYAVLTQSAYTFTATAVTEQFDTLTDKDHYPGGSEASKSEAGYTLTSSDLSVTGYILKSVGTVTLTPKAYGYTAANSPNLVLSVDSLKSTGFTPGTNITYYLVDGSTVVGKLTDAHTWENPSGGNISVAINSNHTGSDGAYYTGKAITLAYGYATTDNSTKWTALGTDYIIGVPPADVKNGSIVFSVTTAA